MKQQGYYFHLVYLWLESPELAISRVSERVRLGGHTVPKATIRRRYQASLNNFFNLYQPITNSWQFYNNSELNCLDLIASGAGTQALKIANSNIRGKIYWRSTVENKSLALALGA